MNIKHNKIRNTGILFELLVRKIATDVLEGNTDSFATKLVREHFHPKSELGKELQLYRSFFNLQQLSETKAFNMLDIILDRRKSLNERTLNTQKFQLIKEIKKNCDLKAFMSGRVPSYKVYASVYKLFESTSRDSTDASTFVQLSELMTARFVVVEHLKGTYSEEKVIKESSYTSAIKDQPEEIRYLSYKFLLERFNEKYSVFSEKQKDLLREYINHGTDVQKFRLFAVKEAKSLTTRIQGKLHAIKDDVVRIKVNEVISQLKALQTKPVIKENYITALLIAYQISHELDSLR